MHKRKNWIYNVSTTLRSSTQNKTASQQPESTKLCQENNVILLWRTVDENTSTLPRPNLRHPVKHPVGLVERDITHGQMLGCIETEDFFHKRNNYIIDADFINKNIALSIKAASVMVDETIDTGKVKLDVQNITLQNFTTCCESTKASVPDDFGTWKSRRTEYT